MKAKLLIVVALFNVIQLFSQTDGWYQIDKPQTINVIVADDVDANIIHVGTNIGYIKYNISTSQVVDFLNLTSQNPAIGNVSTLALNPTNSEIALALPSGIAIYDGVSTVIKYTYDNSSLTLGSSSNMPLELSYGVSGELYIFKSDVFAYQVFNSGIFNAEIATSFRPQDVEENQDGTKIFFAGWNDGLHEYTKATASWVNYTSSNSDLIYNPLEALYRDASGELYVGGFQGFNTIDASGAWSTFQQMVPSSAFFYPAYDFSKNSSGNLMVVTSKPNVSYNGLCLVDEGSNTWTRYYQDGTNCLNSNTFTTASFGGNDKLYASPQVFFGYGKLVEFVPSTNTCTDKDLNYLNAPEISDFTTSFAVRGGAGSGSRGGNAIEIAVADGTTDLGLIGVDLSSFPLQMTNNQINTASFIIYNVSAKRGVLIGESGQGLNLFAGAATNSGFEIEKSFEHGIPGYESRNIKLGSAPNSPNTIEVLQQGIMTNGDYKLLTSQININTLISTPLQEINIPVISTYNVNPKIISGIQTGIAGPLDGFGDNYTSSVCTITPVQGETNPIIFCSESNSPFTPPGTVIIDELLPFNPISEPFLCEGNPNIDAFCVAKDNTTLTCGIINPNTGNLELIDHQEDFDGDSQPDDVVLSSEFTKWEDIDQGELIAKAICGFIGKGYVPTLINVGGTANNNRRAIANYTVSTKPIPNANIASIPDDFFLYDMYLYPNPANSATMILLTNYGFLIKTGIDISNLLLNNKDYKKEILNTVLYPNPSNDLVSFSNDKISSLKVYDINGRKVLEKEDNNFSVKSLAKGVYIVKGQTNENQTISKKLIVN